MITHYFIERPIFSFVISILIFLAGLVSYFQLPVTRYPDIVPPSVNVLVFFQGADPESLVQSVAIPIEQKVNGVDHMLYMQSFNSGEGSYCLQVFFEIGTDPDVATVLVQNRVALASPELPESVVRSGITVEKSAPGTLALLALRAKNNDKNDIYLNNYVSIYIRDEFSRINGIGKADLYDPIDFTMRIWLDPDIMAIRKISVQEIVAAIKEQNIQVACGGIGSCPSPKGQVKSLLLRSKGRLQSAEEFQNIVIRTGENGATLKLKNVAKVELGQYEYNRSSKFNGAECSMIALSQAPDANAINVMKNVHAKIEEMRPMLEQNDLELVTLNDTTDFIHASQDEVKETLVIAVLLVIGIVFLFLQNIRAAIIPALTIPVSLVGCFFIILIFGFSLNTLTLFGLVLVIGIVVDDAIVVVENTQRILNSELISPLDAAKKSIDQVFGPIIGTTCVLCSIFLPTIFAGGILGRLYTQFAITIIGSVLISTICALTIAPALCALFLRPESKKKRFFVFRGFNALFEQFAKLHSGLLRLSLRIPFVILIIWIILVTVLAIGGPLMPTGFIPDEDQGVIMLDMRLPDGATKERTVAVQEKVEKIVRTFPTIEKHYFITGCSYMDSCISENCLGGILKLTPWNNRKEKGCDIDSIQKNLLLRLTREIPEAVSFVYSLPVIEGIGQKDGIECYLMDKRGHGYKALADYGNEFIKKASATGMFRDMTSTFRSAVPQYFLDIDRDKVKRMGIRLDELFASVQNYIGNNYVNEFNDFSRSFHVIICGTAQSRLSVEKILSLPLMNGEGKNVPLRSVATIHEIFSPQCITRFNLSTANGMSAMIQEGKSSGEAMAILEKIVKSFPNDYSLGWGGVSFQEHRIGSTVWVLFAMALLFGFLSLAALYESWSAPLIIMMAVPLGVSGALLAVALFGTEINVYTQIGLILMIGLSAKNAILITEFARKMHRDKGKTPFEAALLAGQLRLRPILMTSFAFILGVVPLAIATGAGANGRRAIGTAVLGGMIEETLIGIIVTPVLFLLITKYKRRKLKSENFIRAFESHSI